jgi:hypothetical protein
MRSRTFGISFAERPTTMKNVIPESRRPRPAAYHSAREIHFFVLRSLAGIRDRCATLARNSAERAALAVELATSGDSPDRNLARALTAIRTSMFHCDTLCAQEIIDRRTHDYLRRRVDQLKAGLEALQATPNDRWLALQLPPLEAEPTEQSEAGPRTLFDSIMERVAKAALSILRRRPSSPDEASSVQGPEPGSRNKVPGDGKR